MKNLSCRIQQVSLALFVLSLAITNLSITPSCFGQANSIVPLFDETTVLEPATTLDTPESLTTYIGDRVRDRHARESQFQAYDHFLSFYWEERTVSLKFIDKVVKGGKEIEVVIKSLAPLNEPNFRCFYRGINTVAEYHQNVIAEEVAANTYSVTISYHPTERRKLQVGDEIEFEFSPFLVDPKHGRSNYYGTTMLYVVGKGVVPWMGSGERLHSVPLPKSALLGGDTTLSYSYSNEPKSRFKQMALNIAPANAQAFMLGRRLHHTNMLNGAHSENSNPKFAEQVGKVGPDYVSESCIACHVNNGRALPPSINNPMYQTVIKVASTPAGSPHPQLGTALQPRSIKGNAEGGAFIARYEKIAGQYADGTAYELRKPIYEFEGEQLKYFSARLTPQLVGLGLLEAVPESSILALADPQDENGDGISGRSQTVVDPTTNNLHLGRFGYKAGQPTIRHQIASALNSDMGVTTTFAPKLDGVATASTPEISDQDLDKLVRYISLLGVNAQRDLEDSTSLHGKQLFEQANCTSCHTPHLRTSEFHPFAELRSQTIQPFTDLLLHDMGEGLADTLGEHLAAGAEWRTAPLWGIGWTRGVSGGEAYLHDGRAGNLEEAILWHGGEAENSREAFRQMSRSDRAALIKFLESL